MRSWSRLPVDPDVDPDIEAAGLLPPAHWDVLLVIAAGGALGSLARWWLGELLDHRAGDFPWATVTENVTGSFALGFLMVLVLELFPTLRYLRPFLGVGVLGGFTTFSTYALDTRTLVVADRPALALLYLGGTLVAGLLAVWVGLGLGRVLVTAAVRRREPAS
jgi:CrcB protein